MRNNSIKWYKIAAVFYACCLLFTPISLYHSYKIYIVVSESLICLLLILLGLNNINKISELLHNGITLIFSRRYSLISFITFLILYFSINYVLSQRIDNGIESNGIITEASISGLHEQISVRHISKYNRSFSSLKPQKKYTALVSFSTKEGKKYTIIKTVDKVFYDANMNTKKIKIRYLPDNPSIFKII